MSLRYTLDEWIMGEDAPPSAARSLLETGGIMLASLALALLFPTASEKVFAITGASAVCIVCYVVPVLVHLLLLRRGAKEAGQEGLEQQNGVQTPLLGQGVQVKQRQQQAWGAAAWVSEVIVPCGVLLLGVGFSLAALWVAVAQLIRG